MRRPTSRRTLVEYLTAHPSVVVVARGTPVRASVPSVFRRKFDKREQEDLFFLDANSVVRHVRTGGPRWRVEFHDDGFDVFKINGQNPDPDISYYYRPDDEAVDSPIPEIYKLAVAGQVIPAEYIAAIGYSEDDGLAVLRAGIICGHFPPGMPESPPAEFVPIPDTVPDVIETPETAIAEA